ncbi:MAG: preprotein translocase subunit YajC [Spirochaetes bacterium]|nr:preprotein translocase subunit YajC [Spirochaetota bacterium]
MLLTSITPLMAQNAATPAQPSGSFLTAIIPFVLVFVIFYLLIIMPSRKKQKKHQEMVEQLKSGDKIITTGGIHGSVMGVHSDKIEVKIAANVKVDVTKNAIAVITSTKKDTK